MIKPTRTGLVILAWIFALVLSGCGSSSTNPFTYFKASNTDPGDEFGRAVAISDDGGTLAVGAYLESSDGVTVPIESNNDEAAAGAVYVFTSTGGWQQQAYLKATTAAAGDQFGFSVALSSDGNTLAVGSPFYDGAGTDRGAVDIFTRSGSTWAHQQQIVGLADNDGYGWAIALSNDGSVLVVGAPLESTTASSSGTVYVYTTTNGWASVATTDTIKAATPSANDQLGVSVSINAAGTTFAAGANQISSAGNGYVKIFVPTGGSSDWATNTGYDERNIVATDGDTDDQFGVAVSLNSAGDVLAVGAYQEDSGQTNDATDDLAADAGAAYVFVTSDSWATTDTEVYVKPSSPAAGDEFGTAVALNGSGDTLAVGATFAGTGGTAYRITNTGTWAGGIASRWAITPSYPDTGDQFGFAVYLSADAGKMAVGAKGENSSATGVNGDQTDDSETDSGAAYIHTP
jgi:hypothetical protein